MAIPKGAFVKQSFSGTQNGPLTTTVTLPVALDMNKTYCSVQSLLIVSGVTITQVHVEMQTSTLMKLVAYWSGFSSYNFTVEVIAMELPDAALGNSAGRLT